MNSQCTTGLPMVVSLLGCRLLGALQAFNVDPLHLHHRLHDALRYCGIWIAQELRQRGRNDLPRQAELVLEPAAHLLLSAGGELLPLLVDLFLGLAIHDERYGLRELELRPAVQGDKFLPVQLEHRGHDRSLRPGPRVSVADDLSLFRILENGDIEIHRLLGPAVEPQEWRDFLHGQALAFCVGFICRIAFCISSGLTSRRCVATDQWWPNGSSILP